MDLSISPMILTVVSAHFLALLSPGPDFVMIIRSSINNNRKKSIGVPFGIAIANAVYIIFCIIGIGEIVLQMKILFRFIEFTGGLFFIIIAINAIKMNKECYQQIFSTDDIKYNNKSFIKSLFSGFISGISNPKNLIFYLSLFSLIITDETDQKLKIVLGVWMVLLVFIWDSFILLLLSQKKVQIYFKKVIYFIDKVAGSLLGILGIKLILLSIS